MAMAYRIETAKVGERTVYTLHDDASGASASILPSYGFNLFDVRLPIAGQVRPIVDAAADFAAHPQHPGRNGTPILFPFPNRIRDGKFQFQGKSYQLPANNGPNAIHGFAIQADWDVVDQKADAQGASLTGRYQISKQSPEMRNLWPTDAVLQIRYTLANAQVTLVAEISNPTADPLPYGFGIHPYYRLPFTHGADQSRTKVILPASEYWVLKEFLPTGERKAVDQRLDFRLGQAMKGLHLDDVLTALPREGETVCRLVDLGLHSEFRLSFGPKFRELVVYTPPGNGGVIAIEPYTQTTDAINLQSRGIDAGLRVLGHGARDSLEIRMDARASA
jgi:aldose 1-epimerase